MTGREEWHLGGPVSWPSAFGWGLDLGVLGSSPLLVPNFPLTGYWAKPFHPSPLPDPPETRLPAPVAVFRHRALPAGGPGPLHAPGPGGAGERGAGSGASRAAGGGATAQFSRRFGWGGRQRLLRGGCEMRSEKEGVGGSGAAVAARGSSGREKPSAVEVQFRRESPRREPEVPPDSSFGCGGVTGKPREEKTVLSKVVIRRLPPSLTKEQLEEQLRPLPAHDYFEFFTADSSLYPHLYSRAYINFRNPDDILLFRDRFDGYIFIDSKGLEYPAVVEFAPFQKIAKKKLKRKDAQTGSIEDDPEYKKFLETYCVEEEKPNANPETLLGDIEAKTRELIARRTTPLLEYIRNRKLEKQRIREEKREERRRRELEKKRLREEEKRKKREEERCKRKEADRQKRAAEREVRIKLLKKPEKGEEPTEKPKERREEVDNGDGKREPCASCAVLKPAPLGSSLEEPKEKSQKDSDKEQREMERGCREKEPEAQRCHMDNSRKHRAHCEFDRFSRRNEEEPKWGKGVPPDRGKKGSQDSGVPVEAAERPGREHRSESGPAPKAERPGNKDRPALQLYQPGARIRARETGGGTSVEGRDGSRDEAEDAAWAGPQKSEEAG